MKNIIGITFFIFMLSGCTSKSERAFMAGCKSSGIKSSICSCTYEKIENHYGKENIAQMDRTGQLPRDFWSFGEVATAQCVVEDLN